MILERAGYKVIAIANPDEAARAFAASPIHAVIFGDSIQADRRIELARTFKRLDPSVPIIALSKTSGSQFPAGIVDEQLESLGDPRLLLDALQRVVARDGDGSASDAPSRDGERTDKSFAHSSDGTSITTTDPKAPGNSAV